jgi:di/tricarboxylate transporter
VLPSHALAYTEERHLIEALGLRVGLGLVWAFAAGGKIFVYQSGVLVAGYSYGYFNARDVFRVGMCVTAMESLVLLFIVPSYWPLIGVK